MNKQVFYTDFYFPSTHVFAGSICLISGLFIFFFKETTIFTLCMSFGLIGGGCFWCFTHKGGLIDFENKRIKPFISFLGIRFGFWKSLADYSCLCELQHINREDLDNPYARGDQNGVFLPQAKGNYFLSRYYNTYEICFLSNDHLKRLPFASSHKKEKIDSIIKIISEKIKMPMVTYNPKINRHR